MMGDPAHGADVPAEVPSVVQLRLTQLLYSELKAAYAAALADGATPAQLAATVAERRAVLRSMECDDSRTDDGQDRVDDPSRPLRVIE